jgi:hypothetical protein
VTDKPPLPVAKFHDWPRIPVDMSDGSDAYQIARVANWAASDWVLGSAGPYKNPDQSMAMIVRSAVREGLLHLLELGFIDIDVERMYAAKGWPMGRADSRPVKDGVPE